MSKETWVNIIPSSEEFEKFKAGIYKELDYEENYGKNGSWYEIEFVTIAYNKWEDSPAKAREYMIKTLTPILENVPVKKESRNRWLELAMMYDSENIRILQNVEKLSDNGISIVMRSKDGNYIYKRSTPFLIENEIWMLNHLSNSGFTPFATRHDKYTITMPNLGVSEKVTDVDEFMANGHRLKMVLITYAVRHGDITPPNIIVKNNFPYIIDWAESRLHRDIRPDKRLGGDDFWIDKTWSEIIENSK